MPQDQVTSEQIEDTMAMLSEMGINVVESEDEAEETTDEKPSTSKELTTTTPKEELDRTDDPVRMYLREMGSIELLSRAGRDRHRHAYRGRPRADDLAACAKAR